MTTTTPILINKITLDSLPKISLNKFYSGMHWKKRKQIKDVFHYLLDKHAMPNTLKKLKVVYKFKWHGEPLDCSNCMGMIKLIEDCLFHDDDTDHICEIVINSVKAKVPKDVLDIEIYQLR